MIHSNVSYTREKVSAEKVNKTRYFMFLLQSKKEKSTMEIYRDSHKRSQQTGNSLDVV